MSSLLILSIVVIISCMLLLTFLAWNKSTRKLIAIVLPLLCVGVYKSYDAIEELKGQPSIVLPSKKWELIGAFQDPPNYIYLLVLVIGEDKPIYVIIPWTKQSGEDAEEATEEGKKGKMKTGQFKKLINPDGTETDTFEFYEFNIEEYLPKK